MPQENKTLSSNVYVTTIIVAAIIFILASGLIASYSRGNAKAARARSAQIATEMHKLEVLRVRAEERYSDCRRDLQMNMLELTAESALSNKMERRSARMAQDLGKTHKIIGAIAEQDEAISDAIIKMEASDRDLSREVDGLQEVREDIKTLEKINQ